MMVCPVTAGHTVVTCASAVIGSLAGQSELKDRTVIVETRKWSRGQSRSSSFPSVPRQHRRDAVTRARELRLRAIDRPGRGSLAALYPFRAASERGYGEPAPSRLGPPPRLSCW